MQSEELVGPSILKILKYNPRGLTVSDVAKKIGINRNSTARHLEVLAAEGKVESRLYGTAKVYSMAQRVPLSAFLCFTKNMILILDENLAVVQANDQYLKFAGRTKQELVGKTIHSAALPIVSTPEALALIQATEKEQTIADIRYRSGIADLFYQIEAIPTTFEGGEHGLTIVLEDITERMKYVKNMEFLARTAMELVDMPPEADIYQYVAEKIAEILPHPPQCFVESFDEVNRQFFMRAIVSRDFRERCAQIVGQDIVGMAFPIHDFIFKAPFNETVATSRPLREYHFKPSFEDEHYSLYDLCVHQIPERACEELVHTLNLGRIYLIGLVWQDQLFGSIGVFMSPESELEDQQVLESFVRQASIALARRYTEDRLRRSEQRFREVLDLSPSPAALIGSDGNYTFVNGRFTETFGYTLQDIPTGKAWFEQAFPDPVRRKEAVAAWTSDLERAGIGEVKPRAFEVRCRNGECKAVLFRPVPLADGTQYVTYETTPEIP